MEKMMPKLKSILIVMICSAFSVTLFILPNAQGAGSSSTAIISQSDSCGDQGVKEIVMGKNKIIGCWDNDDVCKIKCYKPIAEL